jgi:outer membrane biogenesis lipoprotein LolB
MISRSLATVRHQILRQIRHFGLQGRNDDPQPWSDKETAFLIRHYQTKTRQELSTILGRTASSIHIQAIQLNLKDIIPPRLRWTHSENNVIKKYYKKWPTKRIAAKLGRTVGTVQKQAGVLGLWTRKYRPWTADEMDTIKKYYNILSNKKIAEKLKNRTPEAVKRKGIKLGLRKRS